MRSLALPAYAQLSDADEAALTDLYRRGTPANTLRAWKRDLADIAAWKMASFGRPLDWPEEEKVALRFILDHAQDLTEKPGPAQDVAMELIAIGLRRELTCPSPATLDRRIASWQAFHRMRNLPSPFSAPLVQQARQKARRANARPRVPKSPKPGTRDILEALLATCDDSHRGIRDRAMLMLAFASGGRRRSEVTSLSGMPAPLPSNWQSGRHRSDGERHPGRHPPIASASVMQMTATHAQLEGKRQDKSARCDEKHHRRDTTRRLRGLMGPIPAACVTAHGAQGKKRLFYSRNQAIFTTDCRPLGECQLMRS